MIDFFLFAACIQNDSLAMIFIALKYEYSKSKCNKKQVHYQLKFDNPQAGYSCINYDMTEAEANLTVAENLVDAPRPNNVGSSCQGNVKILNLI